MGRLNSEIFDFYNCEFSEKWILKQKNSCILNPGIGACNFENRFWRGFSLNPYLLHFGNIQERHLWKKNPKFTFWSLMTSYMTNNLWRHMNLKLHQLGYLYVTWPKSRDVIRVRYHVMKVITPEKPGTELASFLEKKSRRVWERLGASFLEKISKNGFFG